MSSKLAKVIHENSFVLLKTYLLLKYIADNRLNNRLNTNIKSLLEAEKQQKEK